MYDLTYNIRLSLSYLTQKYCVDKFFMYPVASGFDVPSKKAQQTDPAP
jgi:hypothetical protein